MRESLSCYRKRILYQRNDSWNIDSVERSISNPRHTTAYSDGGKARAIRERRISNARHTVGDGDRGKARATRERIFSNARHAVGDGDRGEARAFIERTTSNARHAIGDGDGGKARAIRVSITNYISTISLLNGRKVRTYIL